MGYHTHFIVVLAQDADRAKSFAKIHMEANEITGTAKRADCLYAGDAESKAISAKAVFAVEEFMREAWESVGKEGVVALEQIHRQGIVFETQPEWGDWYAIEKFAQANMEGVLNVKGEVIYRFMDGNGRVNECFAGSTEIEKVGVSLEYSGEGEDVRSMREYCGDYYTFWVVRCEFHY